MSAYDSLLEWMTRHLPEVIDDLGPPAEKAEIERLERKFGIQFPGAFKDTLAKNDGQRGAIITGLFYGLPFMKLSEIENNWDLLASVWDDDEDDDGKRELSYSCESFTPGAIKEQYICKKWIPFADDSGGNYMGFDFAPGPNGTVGQIINFGRDENLKFVIADSFEEFLEWYVEQLNSGNYSIEVENDGGRSLNTKTPPSGHFLDSIRKMQAGEEDDNESIDNEKKLSSDLSKRPSDSRTKILYSLLIVTLTSLGFMFVN